MNYIKHPNKLILILGLIVSLIIFIQQDMNPKSIFKHVKHSGVNHYSNDPENMSSNGLPSNIRNFNFISAYIYRLSSKTAH